MFFFNPKTLFEKVNIMSKQLDQSQQKLALI